MLLLLIIIMMVLMYCYRTAFYVKPGHHEDRMIYRKMNSINRITTQWSTWLMH